MQSKDWVLLFIPIVCNGIIVYIIQSIFQRYNKKKMDSYEKRRNICNVFFEMLLVCKSDFRTIGYAIINAPDDSERIWKAIGEFNSNIRKILDFYDDHTFFLNKFSKYIAELRNKFDGYVEYFKDKKYLSNNDRTLMSENINLLNELIIKLLDTSQKNI